MVRLMCAGLCVSHIQILQNREIRRSQLRYCAGEVQWVSNSYPGVGIPGEKTFPGVASITRNWANCSHLSRICHVSQQTLPIPNLIRYLGLYAGSAWIMENLIQVKNEEYWSYAWIYAFKTRRSFLHLLNPAKKNTTIRPQPHLSDYILTATAKKNKKLLNKHTPLVTL